MAASRKRPDRADTTIVLGLEACPYCVGKHKELEDVRVRYALNSVVNTSGLSARCENQGSATTMTLGNE